MVLKFKRETNKRRKGFKEHYNVMRWYPFLDIHLDKTFALRKRNLCNYESETSVASGGFLIAKIALPSL